MLKTVLRFNCGFSILTGSLLIFFDSYFMRLLGINESLLLMGINLLGFAALTFYASIHEPPKRTLVMVIITMDIIWILGSVALLIIPTPVTPVGNWIIAIVAFLVADFAFFQYKGLRQVNYK